MPAVSADLKALMSATDLFIFPEDYVVVYLPQTKAISGEWFREATTRFAVVIQEPKRITMVIPRRKWLRMQNIFDKYETNGPWKVISFKMKASYVPTGYLATMEMVLKDAGIETIPVSTMRNSHVLVPRADLPRAVRHLRGFLESCKETKEPRETKEKKKTTGKRS